MRSETPKQFLELSGKPMLTHSVSTFRDCALIAQIIVVVNADCVEATRQMLQRFHLLDDEVRVVAGGRRRQDSVRNGLNEIDDNIAIALVHDGARPLVSESLIKRCYDGIDRHGAAIAAIPVKDTLKRQDVAPFVSQTLDRSRLWQAQTPQGARRELFDKAFEINGDDEVTDESSLFENAGISVALVAGEETNFKVTRPEDLFLAELIMDGRSSAFRIGHGFDAHRFAADRTLVLGGVKIPHDYGLLGHSDADVLCHALCDAILGALGEGDIGRHFPDSDGAYKDISSLLLLEKVVEWAAEKGFVTGNADMTLVCQAPKLSPFMEAMRETIAVHCRVSPGQINIKATTTEKMGYTGRAEGISCHAVVLLQKR
jgi:2-C-methyl-D-erythritol 4-phosphate cytidylyltransferase/2-C-methyl-D-erythritol 2,4-cyclodiphosphate synthase